MFVVTAKLMTREGLPRGSRSQGHPKRRACGSYRCNKNRDRRGKDDVAKSGSVAPEGSGPAGPASRFTAEPGQRPRKERTFFPPFGSGRTVIVLSGAEGLRLSRRLAGRRPAGRRRRACAGSAVGATTANRRFRRFDGVEHCLQRVGNLGHRAGQAARWRTNGSEGGESGVTSAQQPEKGWVPKSAKR